MRSTNHNLPEHFLSPGRHFGGKTKELLQVATFSLSPTSCTLQCFVRNYMKGGKKAQSSLQIAFESGVLS